MGKPKNFKADTKTNNENDVIIKARIKADLRKYVVEQTSMDVNYIKENVSLNAYNAFLEDNLNELIAEVLLQNDKNAVKDNVLLNHIQEMFK